MKRRGFCKRLMMAVVAYGCLSWELERLDRQVLFWDGAILRVVSYEEAMSWQGWGGSGLATGWVVG